MTGFVARVVLAALVLGTLTGGLLGWAGDALLSDGNDPTYGLGLGFEVGLAAGLLLGGLLGVATAAGTALLLARAPQAATRRVARRGALTTALTAAGLTLLALGGDAAMTGGADGPEVRTFALLGLVVLALATPLAYGATTWSARCLREERSAAQAPRSPQAS